MSNITNIDIYFAQIAENELLSKEELNNLIVKAQNGDIEARNKAVEANLKFVVYVAKRYAKGNVSLDDLIQAGNIGLIKSVEHYDVKKSIEFSTYAYYWVRHHILRHISNNGRTIRLPVHKTIEINKMNKVEQELESRLGRKPTDDEIANELNVPVEKVVTLQVVAQQALSLDVNYSEDKDDDLTLLNFVSKDDVESNSMKRISDRELMSYLSCLGPREKLVIIKRWGLDGGLPKTLEEVGNMFNVTRERIRQIEHKAFKKLRNNKKFVEYYKEYVGGQYGAQV